MHMLIDKAILLAAQLHNGAEKNAMAYSRPFKHAYRHRILIFILWEQSSWRYHSWQFVVPTQNDSRNAS